MPPHTRRVAVIINPISGGGGATTARRRAQLAAAVIEASGAIPEIFITERRGHARDLACAARDRGAGVVVAWGGDGTVNEVASALTFTDTPLAIVPSGSGNGLARELGIRRDPASAIADAIAGPTRRIDVGEVAGRLFVNTAGFGFDACVAARFADARWRGLAGYGWLTLATLCRYEPREYTIDTGATRRTIRALLIGVANSRQYGNGAIIAPEAQVDDGRLDLVVIGARPAWRTLQQLPRLFTGRLGTAPDVWIERITHARLTGDAPLLIHVDGEPLPPQEAVEIRVQPGALGVRGPGLDHRRDESATARGQ
jgi:YegS/Rv2252/BmrU family lipid kinase